MHIQTPPISVKSHYGSQTEIDRCACAFKRVGLSIRMLLLSQFAHAYDCRVLHETDSCCFVFTQSVNACLHLIPVSSLLSLTADLSVLGCNRRASLRCKFSHMWEGAWGNTNHHRRPHADRPSAALDRKSSLDAEKWYGKMGIICGGWINIWPSSYSQS